MTRAMEHCDDTVMDPGVCVCPCVCVCVCARAAELNSVDLKGCGSANSLNSNASLPSVQCHRKHTERRVASWAVCFERLLQDPVGVRYFSVGRTHARTHTHTHRHACT